ncbi:MAG: 4-hydroxythreonine-4-phosphate dehydrogenase PdxA [Bdellovibrionaceae bacterium]|nr:4-hydroxythreonine-4-phosphate dehydrogenase PdxA [Pseudobdellovibrionaceae bacterium]
MRRLILTTGDLNGIGAEISAKSLRELKLSSKQNVTVVLHPEQEPAFTRAIGRQLPMFDDWEIAAQTSEPGAQILLDRAAPALWVEQAARACLDEKFAALVTGPLSKPGIIKAGLTDLGHTEILRRVSKSGELYMSFWGSHFNVVLVTGHIPVSKVPKQWTAERIQNVTELTQNFLRATTPDDKRPLAFVGLNPHAGDKSLIGEEEENLGLKSARLVGPLVPDTAFQKENWGKYAAFLCAYHDQGLIPFKLIHGFDEGVHVTLGLPFLRTSVDHGPATELVGTGRAKHGSMKAALKMALDFSP